MGKEFWYTVFGTALGSILEEVAEEIWPIGEQEWTGELIGAILGLLTSQITKDEVKAAFEKFILYAHRRITKSKAESLSDKDLKVFSENFKKIPKKQQKEIVQNFKSLAPYEYGLIRDLLKQAVAGGVK